MFDSKYTARLAKLIAEKPRFAGTRGERRASKIIMDELSSAGYTPIKEGFRVHTYRVLDARLVSLEPDFEVPCSALGFSGETPEEGVEAPLTYIEAGDPALLPENKEYIGLAATRPGKDDWGRLVKTLKGLVIAEGNRYRLPSHVAIPYEWRRKYGSLPAVYVSYENAYRLLSSKKVRLVLRQRYQRRLAYNIIAEKIGYKYPEEFILVTAHYDSVYTVRGAVDNAGGTALAVSLAKALSGGKFKRSIRFILFSGEELGLRGSRAYVERHGEQLEEVKLVVNLDVHGDSIGRIGAIVTGPKELHDYVESRAKIAGYNIQVNDDVMSSDGTVFAEEEIPVVNFYRSGGTNIDMHTIRDKGEYISELGYMVVGPFVEKMLIELLNAEKLPFPRSIPDNLRKKVQEYFRRWRD